MIIATDNVLYSKQIVWNEKVKITLDQKLPIRLSICDSNEMLNNENGYDYWLRHVLSNSEMICLQESTSSSDDETELFSYDYQDDIELNNITTENAVNLSSPTVEEKLPVDYRDLIRLLQSLNYCKLRLKFLMLRNAVDDNGDAYSEKELQFLVRFELYGNDSGKEKLACNFNKHFIMIPSEKIRQNMSNLRQ
jgi:hypothetical protein